MRSPCCLSVYPRNFLDTVKYRVAQKSVNWFVKCTIKMPLLFTEFRRIVRNEILHVQLTTLNFVIPFLKLTGRFKSEHSR
jgi:hypothetical protein